MSTADDACREWIAERTGIAQSQRGIAISEAAFLAGYRRALEDAADAAEGAGLQPAGPWLRRRAASVGTKDGDDDHE